MASVVLKYPGSGHPTNDIVVRPPDFLFPLIYLLMEKCQFLNVRKNGESISSYEVATLMVWLLREKCDLPTSPMMNEKIDQNDKKIYSDNKFVLECVFNGCSEVVASKFRVDFELAKKYFLKMNEVGRGGLVYSEKNQLNKITREQYAYLVYSQISEVTAELSLRGPPHLLANSIPYIKWSVTDGDRSNGDNKNDLKAKINKCLQDSSKRNLLVNSMSNFIASFGKDSGDTVFDFRGNGVAQGNGSSEFKIFYGPPGTGKTREARELVGGCKERYKIVQIHPSSSYEDLIEGIKPVTFPNGDVKYEVQDGPVKIMAKKASDSWVKSIVSARYFSDATSSFVLLNFPIGTMAKWFYPHEKLSCRFLGGECEIVKEQFAQSDTIKIDVTPENKDAWKKIGLTFSSGEIEEVFAQLEFKGNDWGKGNYVLVLDELNRGNVASILGELVFAISEVRGTHTDKKAVALQYSHEQFSWPQSLSLYGTMNSTDVSLDRIDQAIKRRFDFKVVEPDPTLLKIEGVENGLDTYLRDLNLILSNAGTESGAYNVKDKLIGHSYFLPLGESVKDKPQDEEFKRRIGTGLKKLWESQILQSLLSIFNGSSDELDKFVTEKLGQFAPNVDTKKIFGWPFDEATDISGEKKAG